MISSLPANESVQICIEASGNIIAAHAHWVVIVEKGYPVWDAIKVLIRGGADCMTMTGADWNWLVGLLLSLTDGI